MRCWRCSASGTLTLPVAARLRLVSVLAVLATSWLCVHATSAGMIPVGQAADDAATAQPHPHRAAAEVAPYPPMHWHSWSTFAGENEVNETNMREVADALLTSGMAKAGYRTVNVICTGQGCTGRLDIGNTFVPLAIRRTRSSLGS